MVLLPLLFFFFQAEDGIRDTSVTGVQTCALPISNILAAVEQAPVLDQIQPIDGRKAAAGLFPSKRGRGAPEHRQPFAQGRSFSFLAEIGRASCRERRVDRGGGGSMKKRREMTWRA